MKPTLAAVVFASLPIVLGLARPAAAEPVDDLKGWIAQPRESRPPLADQAFAKAKLTKAEAADAKAALLADHVATIKADRQAEWDAKAIKADGQTLLLKERHFGTEPKDGWNLFISMHGGGGTDKATNDSQWQNQIVLPYNPDHSLYIAPRAPTDAWNMWHTKQVDDLYARLIDDAIVLGHVNPNRVYIMGYSAGGDGVYQLAPRMADRLAAAAMMAGHPNDASPLGLRDLPFIGQVGANDGGAQGYHRNEKLTEWGGKMDALQKDDPDGYVHVTKLHPGRPHWMNMEDTEATPWVLKYTRNPLPDKVVWRQSGVTHDRFYWLATSKASAKGGQLAIVSRHGQAFDVEKVAGGLTTLSVLLNDEMGDLDQPVKIKQGDKTLFTGVPTRTIAEIGTTLDERGDPDGVFSATIPVEVK